MKTAFLYACAGLVLASITAISFARQSTAAEDEAANIRKQCSAFVNAWNKHDAKGMAAVFAEDGDSINPMGQLSSGRANVEKAFAAEHASMMKESTVKVLDEPVRLITPDVAISDAEAEISGVVQPDGKPGTVQVHVTNVWKKSGGTWYVFASRPYLKMQAPPPSASTSTPK
jgi:uncharacterized protein (TIGR02246 family)